VVWRWAVARARRCRWVVGFAAPGGWKVNGDVLAAWEGAARRRGRTGPGAAVGGGVRRRKIWIRMARKAERGSAFAELGYVAATGPPEEDPSWGVGTEV